MTNDMIHITELTSRLRDEVFNYLENMVGLDINKLLDVVISSHVSSMSSCLKIIIEPCHDDELNKVVDNFLGSLFMFLKTTQGMTHEKFTVYNDASKAKQ